MKREGKNGRLREIGSSEFVIYPASEKVFFVFFTFTDHSLRFTGITKFDVTLAEKNACALGNFYCVTPQTW
jgi:hypothetical protein